MAEEKDKDLKNQEEKPDENESDSDKNNSKVSEDLENSGEMEETATEKAERLLKDGTSPNKEIKVNKKTFDDKNEKAKLYEAHAPLLDKVLKDPALVERLLETKERGSQEEQVSEFLEERKVQKRREIKDALTEALSNWSDFEKLWEDIKPITDSLTKNGMNYRDALRRGYFAVNPEAAAVERERMAAEGQNRLGAFSSSFSRSPQPAYLKNKPNLSDPEKRVARALGRSEEEYAALLEKHKDWLDTNGFKADID